MENTATIEITEQPIYHLGISCLVCGESVPLTEIEEIRFRHEMNIHSKICDKCRAAILYVREQMPQDS